MSETANVTVASMFGPAIHDKISHHAPFLKFLPVSFSTQSTLPPEVEILLAMPADFQSGQPPIQRPAGWPFGLRWVHLPSSGLDGYPAWMLEDVVVTRTPNL